MALDTRAWAREVMGGGGLGDQRRVKRLVDVAARLASEPGLSLAKACGPGRAGSEGAYRLIRSDKVSDQVITQGAYAATARAAARSPGLLVVIQDTTSLSYTHRVSGLLGDLGGPQATPGRGWLVHNSLLVEAPGGRALGLLDQHWWTREPQARGLGRRRKERAYSDKESVRWEQAARRSAQRLGPELMRRVVMVSDRESDIYEYLQYHRRAGQRFVVRLEQDRALAGPEAREHLHVREALARSPELGRLSIQVPQRGGRPGRQASVALRARQVELRPPPRAGGQKLAPLSVGAVLVQEVQAPPGEEPLSWLLYTSEPIATAQQVAEVVGIYRLRWRVEDYHKCWKSGTRVESLRLQKPQPLRRLATILAHVAVLVLGLHDLANNPQAAGQSSQELLTQEQWQCLWVGQEKDKPLPIGPPSLAWAAQALARLGGWADTKRTGRMGWEALWRGWVRLQERLIGWKMARDVL